MAGERRSARRPGARVSRLKKKASKVVPPPRKVPPRKVERRENVLPRGLRGTPLRDADLSERRVSVEHWDPRLGYRWDTGLAIGRFLEGLRDGKILGVRCHRCDRTVTPPRAFCEWCFQPMDEWVTLQETGTVNTFSICYVTWDMQRLEVPQVPAVIEIDGTSPPAGFLHLIGGLREKSVDGVRREVRVGGRVRAVWKPPAERTGAITDILHFRPI